MATPEFVITTPDGRSVYNFYQSMDDAEEAAKRHPEYLPMTYDQYHQLNREFWLKDPMTEISAETFFEMLEVLPPSKWETVDGVERFCMIEHTSGPYTSQYAAFEGRYFHKTVDAYDRSTWISREMLS